MERGGGKVGRWTVFSALSGWVSGSSGLLYCLSRDELHPLLGGPAAGIQALRGCRCRWASIRSFGVLERISWDLVVGCLRRDPKDGLVKTRDGLAFQKWTSTPRWCTCYTPRLYSTGLGLGECPRVGSPHLQVISVIFHTSPRRGSG